MFAGSIFFLIFVNELNVEPKKRKRVMQNKAEQKAIEIAKKSGLDYEVEKLPFFANRNGKTVESDYFGLFNPKTGKFLNSVSEQYRPVQNMEILKAVIGAVQKFGELDPDKATAKDLNEGRKILIDIPIADDGDFHGDKIQKSVTVVDSKDGSSQLRVGLGSLVMSCENGLYRFRNDHEHMAAKHTAKIEERIQGLKDTLPVAIREVYEMVEKFEQFRSTPVSRELVDDLSKHLLGADKKASDQDAKKDKDKREISGKKRGQIEALYRNMETEVNAKGENLWGILNGVTRWTTHEKSAPRRDNGQLESLALGTNARTNEKALAFVEDAYFKA